MKQAEIDTEKETKRVIRKLRAEVKRCGLSISGKPMSKKRRQELWDRLFVKPHPGKGDK